MINLTHYKKLLDSLEVPCGLLKFEQTKISKFFYVNKIVCELTGYSTEEVFAKSPYDFITGIEQSDSMKLKKGLVTKGRASLELFLKTKENRTIPVNTILKFIDLEGELFISFTLVDITENHKIKKQMNYKRNLLQNVWKNSLNGIAISDENGTVIDANSKYFDIYEYSEEEILNKPFYIIFDEDIRQDAMNQYMVIFNTGDKIPFYESEIITKSGKNKIVRAKYDFIIDENENKLMISSIEDITEEKEKSDALIQSERKFRELFTSINNSVFIHKFNKENFILLT